MEMNKMSKGLETLQQYRNESGKRIYEAGLVNPNGLIFHVRSESDSSIEYDIEDSESGFTCSCPDYEKRGQYLRCKHICSVEEFILHYEERS